METIKILFMHLSYTILEKYALPYSLLKATVFCCKSATVEKEVDWERIYDTYGIPHRVTNISFDTDRRDTGWDVVECVPHFGT